MTKDIYKEIEYAQDYWINPVTREIWIHGIDKSPDDGEKEPGVEYIMANKVIKNLHILRHESTTKPATLHLHTAGGVWEEGMAIYDTIISMPYHVTIISYTHARSMSSIILQAADRRILMPNSYFMFHWGEVATSGYAKGVYSEVDFGKRQDQIMLQIYADVAYKSAKFKGWNKSKIKRYITSKMDSKCNVYLTAQEAVEWGFADEVFKGDWSNLEKK